MRDSSGSATGGRLLSVAVGGDAVFGSGAVFGSDEQAHNIPNASAGHTRAAADRTLTSLHLP
jgi:hypothetical protein